MKNIIKLLSFVVALIFSCLSVVGCAESGKYEYYVIENASYGEYGERSLYDAAFPKGVEKAPIILFIHGGGWTAGSKDGAVKGFVKNSADGYIYVALNYRYIGDGVTCYDILDDITACLVSVKKDAEKLGVEVGKMMIYGYSAGGHLSLMYAYKMADESPFEVGMVASYSGVTDLNDENYYLNEKYLPNYLDWFSKLSGKSVTADNLSKARDAFAAVSPINYVSAAVPTIIAHGENDDLVPLSNAVSLKHALDFAGVENKLIVYADSGHGLENDEHASARCGKLVEEFKEKYLKSSISYQ